MNARFTSESSHLPESGGSDPTQLENRDHARDGAIIFSDLIGKLDMLRVACDKCALRQWRVRNSRGTAAARSPLHWALFRLGAEIGTAGAQQQPFDLLN